MDCWLEGPREMVVSPKVISTVGVNVFSPEAALDMAFESLRARRSFVLFTLNLDHIAKLRRDPEFRRCYETADLVSADGWPVVWLYRRNGFEIERTTGADMVAPMCARAADEGLAVYFVGPMPDVQERALGILRGRRPDLEIAGAEAPIISPLDSEQVDEVASRIRGSGARLCFIALGAPKQELIAGALRSLCPGVGFVCVGAALDFIAGASRRAPQWIQKAGLEWAWRLLSDPRNLFARYVECAYVFALLATRRQYLNAEPSCTAGTPAGRQPRK